MYILAHTYYVKSLSAISNPYVPFKIIPTFATYHTIYTNTYVEVDNWSLPYRGVLIRSVLNSIVHIADEFRKCLLKIIWEASIYFLYVSLE